MTPAQLAAQCYRDAGVDPPPFAPVADAIRWLEDSYHGPSRPRTWRCVLGRCPHRALA